MLWILQDKGEGYVFIQWIQARPAPTVICPRFPLPNKNTYKHVESFTDNRWKSFLLFPSNNWIISPFDIDALSDYLNSGGQYSDIQIPRMYLLKLTCIDILKQFDRLLEEKIRDRSTPDIKLLLQTLKIVILRMVPRQAHRSTQLDKVIKKGMMGASGKYLQSYQLYNNYMGLNKFHWMDYIDSHLIVP